MSGPARPSAGQWTSRQHANACPSPVTAAAAASLPSHYRRRHSGGSLPLGSSSSSSSGAYQSCSPLHHHRQLPSRVRGAAGSGDGEASIVGGLDWAEEQADTLRALPLAAGGAGVVGVLLNRLIFGVAPVVDASSSQSRADVVVIGMSAALLLTGLSWLSVKPKPLSTITLEGGLVDYIDQGLPPAAAAELRWAWASLRSATRTRALIVFWRGACVAHLGAAAAPASAAPSAAKPGPISERAMASGKGTYFANLAPYPGRVEFAPYLPGNVPALLVQPVGDAGVALVAADAQRGFSRLDQAWVAAIADKVETSLEGWAPAGAGFRGGGGGGGGGGFGSRTKQ